MERQSLQGGEPQGTGRKKEEGRARVEGAVERNTRKRQKQREKERERRKEQTAKHQEKVIQAHEPTSDICQREMGGWGCTIEKAWEILPGREAGVVGGEGRLNTDSGRHRSDRTGPGPPLRPPLRYFGSKTSSYRYPVFTSSQTLQ